METETEIVATAVRTAETGEWTCPECGWRRTGEPEGVVTCEGCGIHGFDFEIASTELPEVVDGATIGPGYVPGPRPCENCPDPCDECTQEEFEAALAEAMQLRRDAQD